MGEKVIVALDRDLANRLHDAATADDALGQIEHEVVAALDRDREELETRIATLIDAGVRGHVEAVNGPKDLARAVLSAIEGADHE